MKQLDKKAVWLFFISLAIRSVFFGILMLLWLSTMFIQWREMEMGISPGGVFSLVIISLLALIIISFIWSKLAYHYYRYELREDGFRKELGVIYKKYVTIPYDRIQNVDINRGILDRLLGLSRLSIHTAGVGGVATAEGNLPGLSKIDAELLRDELIARARQNRTSQGL